MTTRQKFASAAVVAMLAIAGAVGVALPASAGSGYISCPGGSQFADNANTGSTSESTTNSDGTCGVVKMRAKTYVGGGSYGWTSTKSYGTGAACWIRTYPATLSHSQHYWSYNGNATSKTIAV